MLPSLLDWSCPPSIEEPRFAAGPSFLFEFCQINSSRVSIFLEQLLCLVFECFLSGKLGLWLVASVHTLLQVILVHCLVPLKHTSDQGCAVALDRATVLISLPSLVRQAPAREYPAYCFVQCGRREPARLLGTLDSAISDPGRALTQARTQWLKQHFLLLCEHLWLVSTFGP